MTSDPNHSNEKSGLVTEPKAQSADDAQFERQLERTLDDTEAAVIGFAGTPQGSIEAQSWEVAKKTVHAFKPVPWFIWRLSNFVLGKSAQVNPVNEGLVLGLRRLLFAAASDTTLGSGSKVNNVREALKILEPDVVAAIAVIHAVSRRLGTKEFERIWRPILDDALLRAQIGFIVGNRSAEFGPGRAMLAGFAGRCGLAIAIASGSIESARAALEMLATGAEIGDVGLKIYACDPLQISAMTLSAAGCGRDAAFGTVSYASRSKTNFKPLIQDPGQELWYAAFAITEKIRMNQADQLPDAIWETLGISKEDRFEILDQTKKSVRRGHGWNWL